jgi:Ala-tRNA(Pro) deacylase
MPALGPSRGGPLARYPPRRVHQPLRPISPDAMPATRSDLFARLDELGISTTTVEHPAVFTVSESSGLERSLPGGHTKNLFLKDAKDRLFLIIAQSSTPVDLKSLHKTLGCARLSFGKPELLMQVLGVPAGSVTAFSLINDTGHRVSVVVDAALMQHDSVNCHPLENTATTNISRDNLLKFIRACGHDPRILGLSGPATAEASESPSPPTA